MVSEQTGRRRKEIWNLKMKDFLKDFSVRASDVKVYTEAIASSRHPIKSGFVFARRDIQKG